MKKVNNYCVAIKFPAPWSSNDSEVDWYDVKATSEESAKKIAKRRAARRLKAIVMNINGERTEQYFN